MLPRAAEVLTPLESARHRPYPTPVGEKSEREKPGAALISFWEVRMVCSSLFFRPCFQQTTEWTISRLYADRSQAEGGDEDKA